MKNSDSKIKILFVCLGNICRSPMAEFVMKNLVEKAGLLDMFEIASAATSTEEIGNPVYPPVRRLLNSHSIDCSGKRARQITKADFDYYDYIIAMDNSNLRNINRFIGNAYDDKIHLLLDFTENHGEIADPWYSGNFELTWKEVNEGCESLLASLQ